MAEIFFSLSKAFFDFSSMAIKECAVCHVIPETRDTF